MHRDDGTVHDHQRLCGMMIAETSVQWAEINLRGSSGGRIWTREPNVEEDGILEADRNWRS